MIVCRSAMMMAMGRDNDDDGGDHCPCRAYSDLPFFSCDSPPPFGFIHHSVSKMDTLAGIAIKYGVEVADIKRINGLVTDLHMFALKSLRIPTPGRHPPSPCLSVGSHSPGRSCIDNIQLRRHSDAYDSPGSLKTISPSKKLSPAMSILQDYYGIQSVNGKNAPEGFEMAVHMNRVAHHTEDDQLAKASSPASGLPLSCQRKSRSAANGFVSVNGGASVDVPIKEAKELDSDKWNEKLIRRRQKSEATINSRPSVLLLEDKSSGGRFLAKAGKCSGLRPKAPSCANSVRETDAGWLNPVGLCDSIVADVSSGVRKSSSASSLHNNGSSPIRPTAKCMQVLSGAATIRPIFDGLPKPTVRRNKAALD